MNYLKHIKNLSGNFLICENYSLKTKVQFSFLCQLAEIFVKSSLRVKKIAIPVTRARDRGGSRNKYTQRNAILSRGKGRSGGGSTLTQMCDRMCGSEESNFTLQTAILSHHTDRGTGTQGGV